MSPERLQQIEELYHSAMERALGEREAFLMEACGSDADLKREVKALLEQDSGAGPMGRPVLEVAAGLLADSTDAQWTAGTQVGPYQIVSRIGEGGMGEVFKARDTRLGREVAIKAVHQEFSGRFQREARAISALNHSNICTLFDVGPNYLVMELLDGATLATHLQKGRMPMKSVLRYGEQIADALAAAHAKGIIHRDLKPGNIIITKAGVKVLDFGLAKFAPSRDSIGEPIDTLTASEAIVGTPAYMAPEQLEGKECDSRTDIFALGMVLYEMATGKRPFDGDSRAAVIADIMRCEPLLAALSPPYFAHVVERCLAKEPDDRWQTARDVKLELAFQSRAIPVVPPPAKRRRRLWLAAATASLAALAAAVVYYSSGQTAPFVAAFTSYPGNEVTPSFSPDGSQVVFAWDGESGNNYDIYVKQIGPGSPRQLTKDPADEVRPRWSPDGKWIAFLRTQANNTAGVYVIPAGGGLENKVGDAFAVFPVYLQGLDWSPDGKWLAITQRASPESQPGLALLSFETREIRQITSPPAPLQDVRAVFAPDGHALAFQRMGPGGGSRSLMLLALSGSLQPRGEARKMTTGISTPITSVSWTADSRDLVISAGVNEGAALWRLPASGGSSPELLAFAREGAYDPFVSRGGDRMVFRRFTIEWHIWSLELDAAGRATGPAVRAFDSTRSEFAPRFSPDGTKVAFTSSRSGYDEIWVCLSDGSDCDQVTTIRSHAGSPDWSPDGKWIAFDALREEGAQITIIGAGGGKPKLLVPGVIPRWSRDGQWIYFNCLPARQICRIPAAGGNTQTITGAEGTSSQESPDSKWLYYSKEGEGLPSSLRRVPLSGGDSMEVLDHVAGGNWIVLDTGIWFMTPGAQSSLLQFYDFATKSTRTVYQTNRPVYGRLTLTPDRHRILFTQTDRHSGNDIMLVENFR